MRFGTVSVVAAAIVLSAANVEGVLRGSTSREDATELENGTINSYRALGMSGMSGMSGGSNDGGGNGGSGDDGDSRATDGSDGAGCVGVDTKDGCEGKLGFCFGGCCILIWRKTNIAAVSLPFR